MSQETREENRSVGGVLTHAAESVKTAITNVVYPPVTLPPKGKLPFTFTRNIDGTYSAYIPTVGSLYLVSSETKVAMTCAVRPYAVDLNSLSAGEYSIVVTRSSSGSFVAYFGETETISSVFTDAIANINICTIDGAYKTSHFKASGVIYLEGSLIYIPKNHDILFFESENGDGLFQIYTNDKAVSLREEFYSYEGEFSSGWNQIGDGDWWGYLSVEESPDGSSKNKVYLHKRSIDEETGELTEDNAWIRFPVCKIETERKNAIQYASGTKVLYTNLGDAEDSANWCVTQGYALNGFNSAEPRINLFSSGMPMINTNGEKIHLYDMDDYSSEEPSEINGYFRLPYFNGRYEKNRWWCMVNGKCGYIGEESHIAKNATADHIFPICGINDQPRWGGLIVNVGRTQDGLERIAPDKDLDMGKRIAKAINCEKVVILQNEEAKIGDVKLEFEKLAGEFDNVFFCIFCHGARPVGGSTVGEADDVNEGMSLYNGIMCDNEMYPLLAMVKNKCWAIFDCCYSGTMGDVSLAQYIPPNGSILTWSAAYEDIEGWMNNGGGVLPQAIMRHLSPLKTFDQLWNEVSNDSELLRWTPPYKEEYGTKFKNTRLCE